MHQSCIRYFFLSLSCILFSIPVLAEEQLPTDTLIFDWKTEGAGQEIKGLTISPDQTFYFHRADEETPRQGYWLAQGDSLWLQYELLPLNSSIDSIAYRVESGQGMLLMYSDGVEIVNYDGDQPESLRRREGYSWAFTESGSLVMEGANESLTFRPRPVLKSHSITFWDVLRGILGVFSMLAIAYLISGNRRAINWKLVASGVIMQFSLAVLILRVPGASKAFSYISGGFVTLLSFTREGENFLFGSLLSNLGPDEIVFAFQVLTVIIFFSALTAMLYYLGILQRVVYVFAWLMKKTMHLSGAESLSVAGNIFLGQTEAPLLVRPYLEGMSRSEILTLMAGGMATIAGSVFAAYISFLGGGDPVLRQQFATHLLTASIMAAPAAVVISKIILPETEDIDTNLHIPKERLGSNLLDAISIGTRDGLKLAVNVGVMLLVFISLIRLVNYLLSDQIGEITGLNQWVASVSDGTFAAFNLQFILGILGAPLAWLMGVPNVDVLMVGQFIGEKTAINEFIAYKSLGAAKTAGLISYSKSVIISTYALCGFANFSSIGIQIGGISALAPNQRNNLASLGLRAMICGALAAFMTASMAGFLVST